MIRSIRTLAWLRDLVIAILVIAGIDLFHSSPRMAILLLVCALVIFVERFVWSWYLLGLPVHKDSSQHSA